MSNNTIFPKRFNIVTNFVMAFFLFSIGALCLAPIEQSVKTQGNETKIYRSGTHQRGVSLLFNVYEGSEQVYRILDVLEKYNAHATFFIGGCWADDNVECLRDINAAGHEIGNHGYFHKAHERMNLSQNLKEISDCNRFIELAIDKKVTLFAPPSGAYNANTLTACERLGMKTILWSKDTVDWRDQNAATIYSRATSNVRGGDFILMHPKPATADALDDILKYYYENNLEAITVSNNLDEKG